MILAWLNRDLLMTLNLSWIEAITYGSSDKRKVTGPWAMQDSSFTLIVLISSTQNLQPGFWPNFLENKASGKEFKGLFDDWDFEVQDVRMKTRCMHLYFVVIKSDRQNCPKDWMQVYLRATLVIWKKWRGEKEKRSFRVPSSSDFIIYERNSRNRRCLCAVEI